MNYAIIENESMCEDLERIACWLREKDENLSQKSENDLISWQVKLRAVAPSLKTL